MISVRTVFPGSNHRALMTDYGETRLKLAVSSGIEGNEGSGLCDGTLIYRGTERGWLAATCCSYVATIILSRHAEGAKLATQYDFWSLIFSLGT